MFTLNWYKAASTRFTNKSGHTATSVTGESCNVSPGYLNQFQDLCKSDTGSNIPCLNNVETSFDNHGGVVFGTGNTPPQISDTALSGDIVSNITYNNTLNIVHDDRYSSIEANYTITNVADSPITIGEVALMAAMGTSNSNKKYKCILERTALETPITIAPGGVGQVTYTIQMNYPVG